MTSLRQFNRYLLLHKLNAAGRRGGKLELLLLEAARDRGRRARQLEIEAVTRDGSFEFYERLPASVYLPTVVSEQGKEAVVAVLGIDDFFGEGCLAGQPLRLSTVSAMTQCVIVRIADPVAAGDGAVSLMERIWPTFQDIDTSSGALGTAVARTLGALIPILIDAPADHSTRSKWLARLFEAGQNDGVEYLAPVEDRWGEIARYPDLINEYADRLIGMVRRAWADHKTFQHVIGTSICLSSLLEAGRYDELAELLATRRMKFWSWHRFGAEALVRHGLWEAAIAYAAEGVRSNTNPGYREISIDRFCEDLLIRHSRSDEAYRLYGLRAMSGTTNLAIYRSLVRAYPDRDHRQMLLDLIETRGDKGKWFAAAKDAGFFDIALDCAAMHNADPSTLVRAARDYEHYTAILEYLLLLVLCGILDTHPRNHHSEPGFNRI